MNFFLSLSLVLFVVALNSRSAYCGFELPHESKVITTPRPTACGGSVAKNIPQRGIHYRWYARHISPFASKGAQGFTSSSGLVAPHFTNEPRHWSFNLLPRDNAPRTFEGARGFQAPYFAYAPRFSPSNMFPRAQAPFASGGPHGPPPYFADAQSYSPPPPHQLRLSAFGGLLRSILQKEFPSVPGGVRTIYFVQKNNPHGVAVTMIRGSNSHPVPAPRPLPKARLIGRIPSDQVGEFLRQIMGYGSTSSKTAFKTPTSNGNKPGPITYRPIYVNSPYRHFPKTVFKPLNIRKPDAKPSQYTPTHVFRQEPMSLRSWFTAVPN